MPGSPPIKTTEPGTIPPPRTRENSPIDRGRRSSTSPLISDRRRGEERPASPDEERATAGAEAATTSSTMLFQAPHCGQRPISRALVRPHCWQMYWVRVLDITGIITANCRMLVFGAKTNRAEGSA